jgi:hypothetical protein
MHTGRTALAGVVLLAVAAPLGAGLPDGKPNTEARPRDRTATEEAAFRRERVVRALVAQFGAPDLGTRLALLGVTQAAVQALDRNAGEEFWFDRQRQGAGAAAQLAGVRDPIAVLALRIHGQRMLVWKEKEVERAPALNATWLGEVDDRKLFLDLRARAPDELLSPPLRPRYYEYLAYCEAVVASDSTPRDAFVKSAADNSHLNFTHLYNTPDLHRGKVVHLEGRLKRVTRLDAPREAQRRGVRTIYEGWIFLDRPGTPPVCVIFTDLPHGLAEGDQVDRRVTFDGYFFKKYRYVTGQKDPQGRNKEMITLLCIGPTVIPQGQAAPAQARVAPLPTGLLYGVVAFVAIIAALLLGLNLWYRRNDRLVQSRLRAMETPRFEDQGPEWEDASAGGLSAPGEGLREGPPPAEGQPKP